MSDDDNLSLTVKNTDEITNQVCWRNLTYFCLCFSFLFVVECKIERTEHPCSQCLFPQSCYIETRSSVNITSHTHTLSLILLSPTIEICFSMTCESPLSGNVLQMNFVTFYPDQCTSSGETNTCKGQFIKELQDAFNTLADIPMDVEFKDDRSANIRIKICGLAEKTGNNERNHRC